MANKELTIVYPKENKAIVKKIVSRLESDGISCYVSPRDYRQDEKNDILQVISQSNLLVVLVDNSATNNKEIAQAIEIALENKKEIIPFVIEKISQNIYTSYFYYKLSWIDAYSDSFESAYDLLIETYQELSGYKKTGRSKQQAKTIGKGKFSGLRMFGIAAVLLGLIGYLVYIGLSNDKHDNPLIGNWKITDYKDNMVRTKQDSILLVQSLQNLMTNGGLVINADQTFERRGYTAQPQTGKWELSPDTSVLYLQPKGMAQKEFVNIEKLTENELVIFVHEQTDSLNKVTTRIFYTKK
jgi:hypothetical protein